MTRDASGYWAITDKKDDTVASSSVAGQGVPFGGWSLSSGQVRLKVNLCNLVYTFEQGYGCNLIYFRKRMSLLSAAIYYRC